jgi:hypothetical protein
MWEQDTLIVRQYERGRRSPEKRLLTAVLWNALLEFQDRVQAGAADDDLQFRELWNWFFDHDERWPFSFENLCGQLDLDAGCIRAKLARMTKEQPATVQRRKRRAG